MNEMVKILACNINNWHNLQNKKKSIIWGKKTRYWLESKITFELIVEF